MSEYMTRPSHVEAFKTKSGHSISMTEERVVQWININTPPDVRLWIGDKTRRLALAEKEISDIKAAITDLTDDLCSYTNLCGCGHPECWECEEDEHNKSQIEKYRRLVEKES